jgi:hypothetical protein
MGKTTYLGLAGPDDPIYKGGLQCFTAIPRPAPNEPAEVSLHIPDEQELFEEENEEMFRVAREEAKKNQGGKGDTPASNRRVDAVHRARRDASSGNEKPSGAYLRGSRDNGEGLRLLKSQ